MHAMLQTAMDWQGCHLHPFDVDGVLYGDVEEIEGRAPGYEENFTVARACDAVSAFMYEYDFGDGCHHDVVIEQAMPSVGAGTTHLIDGGGACPPEDCGGAGSFQRLLEVLADPSSDEHDDVLE